MTRLAAILLALASLAGAALAEVSVELDGEDYDGLIIMGRGGGDGGAPWPWAIDRPLIEGRTLNPDGDTNGDGQPAFAIDPRTGFPSIVWAWFDGDDYEIVLSRWTGTGWSPWQLLTSNATDDLDPAVSIDGAGEHHVCWWREDGIAQVWGREGDPESEVWEHESLVSGDKGIGQRPSSAWQSGEWIVAFEADPLEAGLKLVKVVRRRGETTRRDLVGSSVADGPEAEIDVQVHSWGDDLLWVDWLDAPGVLAWSVFDPATEDWSVTEYESFSWGDPSEEYIEREFARGRLRMRLIRQRGALGPID